MRKLKRVQVTIDCENDAFDEPLEEVSRLLIEAGRKVGLQVQREPCLCTADEAADVLHDANGNRCGRVRTWYEERAEELGEEDEEEMLDESEDHFFDRGAGAALLGVGDIDSVLEDMPCKVRDHFYEGHRVAISARRGEGKEAAERMRQQVEAIHHARPLLTVTVTGSVSEEYLAEVHRWVEEGIGNAPMPHPPAGVEVRVCRP